MGDDFRLHRRAIQFQDRCLHVTEQDTAVQKQQRYPKEERRQTQQAGLPNSNKKSVKQNHMLQDTVVQYNHSKQMSYQKIQRLQKQRSTFFRWWYSSEDIASAGT